MKKFFVVAAVAVVLAAVLVAATGVIEQPPKLAAKPAKPYPLVFPHRRQWIPCSSGMNSTMQCCGGFQVPAKGWYCCVGGNACPVGSTCAYQPAATAGMECTVGAGNYGRVDSMPGMFAHHLKNE